MAVEQFNLVDRTAADVANPGAKPQVYRFPAVKARYVRLTATRLARRDGNNFGLALAGMQVLAGAKNVADGARPFASDSVDAGAWSIQNLVGRQSRPRISSAWPSPSTMLRKEFQLGGAVRRATVYVTAMGLYELRINGRRVGDHRLAP